MSANELPGTADGRPSPDKARDAPQCPTVAQLRAVFELPPSFGASDAPQSTTPPVTEGSGEAAPGLDLRDYELIERLGGGGMGDVYRAGDPALGRDLAVKVMKAELQGCAAAEQRFLREARVTGSLQHPGIVPIHNLGRLADGRLHYTMRLVRGQTFAAILREEAGRPEHLPALLTIFEKACQAVAYAHSKRVIHRDLKPANIMVGRFGELQVMDWGLAKVLTAEDGPAEVEGAADVGGTRIHTEAVDTPLAQTQMGREMGTPAYMPPEQALGEWDTVDEHADVFALGAILCEILTGQPPYRGRDSAEALRKAKRGDLTEALARLEGCGADAALVGLCRECLAPEREGRPRDAEQVAQRVAAYQAEVQERLRRVEVERAAAVVKAREERKRRRWMVAAVLLLLAGVAVSTWQAVRATNAEGSARENEGRALQAAQAERQANSLAQSRLRQIEKANEALTSIFRDLDPRAEESGGPSVRQQLSRHLERAARQLDEAAVGDPVAAARLQSELATSLLHLGQTKLALELLSKAVRTLQASLGSDHPDTLATRNNLANAYWSAGRLADAIRLNEQTLKQREAKVGIDHPDTLNSRNSLAAALQSAGRTAEAIPLLEQTLRQREAKLGPDHPDTLATRNNLAVAYRSAGRTAEAIPLHEQTLRQREAKLGPDHPDTLNSRNNLANAYGSVGRITAAIRLHEQTLRQRETKLGLDHPHTLMSMANLGAANREAGRVEEAIRLLDTALRRGRRRPEGLPALIAWVPGILAQTYEQVGQLAKAESIYRDLLQQAQREYGSGDPQKAAALGQLGTNVLKQKRFTEAEPLLRQCLTIRAKTQPDEWTTFHTCSALGEALLGQPKYAEAEPLLVQGYEGMKQRQDTIPPAYRQVCLTEALERLVRLYEAAEQKAKAADWRRKLQETKAAQKKLQP
jgi:serine/threonine protein kinase